MSDKPAKIDVPYVIGWILIIGGFGAAIGVLIVSAMAG